MNQTGTAQESGDYQAMHLVASERTVPLSLQYNLLVASYAGIWVILFVTLLLLWKKQGRIHEEIQSLKDRWDVP